MEGNFGLFIRRFEDNIGSVGLTDKHYRTTKKRRVVEETVEALIEDSEEEELSDVEEPDQPQNPEADIDMTRACCSKLCLTKIPQESVKARRRLLDSFSFSESKVFFMTILGVCGLSENQSNYKYVFDAKTTICSKAFMFIHQCGANKIKDVKKRILERGLVFSPHRNTGQKSNFRASIDVCRAAFIFFMRFSKDEGMPSPGRDRRLDDTMDIYLPTSLVKEDVYRKYRSCFPENIPDDTEPINLPLSRSSFKRMWKTHAPEIVITPKKSDMCDTCKAYYIDPSDDVDINEHHTKHVTERLFYNDSRDLAMKSNKQILHLSADYAQNLPVPYSLLQEGSIYFLSQAKVFVFGVVDEGSYDPVNKQIMLVSEAMETGKGSRAVISMMHRQLTTKSAPEVILNFDNCSGQNKNNVMMWYLYYRVLADLNEKIHVHFMIPGHTKFSPDALFGTVKKGLKRFDQDDIEDINSIINSMNPATTSSIADAVPVYDWVAMFEKFFRTIDNIKKYQHFVFDKNANGDVCLTVYESALQKPRYNEGDSGVLIPMLKRGQRKDRIIASLGTLQDLKPFLLVPEGLTEDRKVYLRKLARHARPENRHKYHFGAPPVDDAPLQLDGVNDQN